MFDKDNKFGFINNNDNSNNNIEGLDNIKTDINNIKDDVNELNTQYKDIATNKADKNSIFTMANMGQDIKEAMTGGSVAVVGKNAVLNENIADGQISENKTIFFRKSKNLYNSKTNISNKMLMIDASGAGGLWDAEGWATTDFIEVEPETSYTFSKDTVLFINKHTGYFDSSKKFIAGEYDKSTITTPANCKYIRISAQNLNSNNINQIEKGVVATKHVGYYALKDDYIEDDTNINELKENVNDLIGGEFINISMFESIGVVGDSFASGGIYSEPNVTDGMYYNLSWVSGFGRSNGINMKNYSQSGMTTKTWLTEPKGLTKALTDTPCGLYLLCLGINDSNTSGYEVGSITDIKSDYTQNPDTFYGNYAKIYEQLKNHSANKSKFVFVAPPVSTSGAVIEAIKNIAAHYNVPLITTENYSFFKSSFFKDSMNTISYHPTAIGYAGMAKAYEKLLRICIQNNIDYFRDYCGVN